MAALMPTPASGPGRPASCSSGTSPSRSSSRRRRPSDWLSRPGAGITRRAELVPCCEAAMGHEDDQPRSHRATLLSGLLTLVAGGAGFIFLFMMGGAYVLWALVVVLAFSAFVSLHYLFWG